MSAIPLHVKGSVGGGMCVAYGPPSLIDVSVCYSGRMHANICLRCCGVWRAVVPLNHANNTSTECEQMLLSSCPPLFPPPILSQCSLFSSSQSLSLSYASSCYLCPPPSLCPPSFLRHLLLPITLCVYSFVLFQWVWGRPSVGATCGKHSSTFNFLKSLFSPI